MNIRIRFIDNIMDDIVIIQIVTVITKPRAVDVYKIG